jgi:DNA replicative helicase MCM subunit Mcm2 (Cdc46/Mcm family)
MVVYNMYDEVADFIGKMNPSKILELKAPIESKDRVYALIEKEKEEGLSTSEKDELDHYLVLERLIRLAKAHARVQIANL